MRPEGRAPADLEGNVSGVSDVKQIVSRSGAVKGRIMIIMREEAGDGRPVVRDSRGWEFVLGKLGPLIWGRR